MSLPGTQSPRRGHATAPPTWNFPRDAAKVAKNVFGLYGMFSARLSHIGMRFRTPVFAPKIAPQRSPFAGDRHRLSGVGDRAPKRWTDDSISRLLCGVRARIRRGVGRQGRLPYRGNFSAWEGRNSVHSVPARLGLFGNAGQGLLQRLQLGGPVRRGRELGKGAREDRVGEAARDPGGVVDEA